MRKLAYYCLSFWIFLTVLSCSDRQILVPSFDGNQAFSYLEKQVSFGPRVPGSSNSTECRNYYSNHFSSINMVVDSQVFDYFDPYSQQKIRMVNMIASYSTENQKDSDRILLMAHYDSRPRTDYPSDTLLYNQPIDGANDGASGVAVLMALGTIFKDSPPPCNVDIVLFDGEDWGKSGDKQNYLIGSRQFARTDVRSKYKFGILLDMIGDSDQQIYREYFSDLYAAEVNNMVFETAKRLGLETFVDSVKYNITDDHLSLNSSGVPSVDIIDFDYPYWHTEFDTPDKCSAESLANVGNLLLEIIYNKSIWPN